MTSSARSVTSSPSIVLMAVISPSIGARISEFSSAPRAFSRLRRAWRDCDRARSVPLSSSVRRRFTSLLAFSNSTCGNVAERGQFFEPAQVVLGDFERFGGRERQLSALGRGLKIGARLFQLPRRRFVRDRRQQFAFLHMPADRAAPGRKRFRQLDEPGVLRPDRDAPKSARCGPCRKWPRWRCRAGRPRLPPPAGLKNK